MRSPSLEGWVGQEQCTSQRCEGLCTVAVSWTKDRVDPTCKFLQLGDKRRAQFFLGLAMIDKATKRIDQLRKTQRAYQRESDFQVALTEKRYKFTELVLKLREIEHQSSHWTKKLFVEHS